MKKKPLSSAVGVFTVLKELKYLKQKSYNYESTNFNWRNPRRHIMGNVRSLSALEAQSEHLRQAG
jgi:hypothetical protein